MNKKPSSTRICKVCKDAVELGKDCRNGCDIPWSGDSLPVGQTRIGLDGKPIGGTGFWKVPTTRH